jgi:hypothetical protein
MAPFRSKAAYHFVEKPPHTVTRRDSLKENRTSNRIGRLRNANPTTTEARLNALNRFIGACP